jgi:O-antigen biosynthesis protein
LRDNGWGRNARSGVRGGELEGIGMTLLFDDYGLLAGSGLFDAEYYLTTNPDVAALNVDPLVHYLELGASEGRNPCSLFDAAYYAEQCRARGERPENPLLHFLTLGAARGLKARREPAADAAPRARAHETQSAIVVAIDALAIESRPDGGSGLRAEGWAIAATPIVEIAASIGDQVIGHAMYGLPRPDVGRIYPQFEKVDHSGFVLTVDKLPADVRGKVELVLSARTADGKVGRRAVPVDIARSEAAKGGEAEALQAKADSAVGLPPMQLHVERVSIDDRGMLHVEGWAVCFVQIAAVNVFIDDERLGGAELGRVRDDVANVCREYPNARFAGFSLVANVGAYGAGNRAVKIQAVARTGISREALLRLDFNEVLQAQRSVEEREFRYSCDEILLTTRGLLDVAGWAAGEAPTESITLFLDGAEIGVAELGQERPDVGNLHPALPHARQSGFTFRKELGRLLQGEHMVTLRMRSIGGEAREVPLPVRAVERSDLRAPGGPSVPESDPEVKIYLDSPHLVDGRAISPARNSLLINGWALARRGVAGIDITIDDELVAKAYYGIRRQDVANTFPDWENALLSGFAALIPRTKLTLGRQNLCVVLRDNAGKTATVPFYVDVEELSGGEEQGARGGAWSLRRAMSRAEIELQMRVLAGLDWHPTFCLLLVTGADEEAVARARASLAALAEQAYGGWRLLIAVRGEVESLASLRARLLEGLEEIAERVEMLGPESPRHLADLVVGRSPEDRPALFALLGAGDLLSCDALLELAVSTGLQRDADFVYSDERRTSPVTGVVDAFFKPQWSPDLLLSTNYIGRLWCAKAELLARADCTLDDLLRFGDYDAALRLTEAARMIRHVPLVLCQRSSTHLDDEAAETEALGRALERRNLRGEVRLGCARGIYRVRRQATASPLVSIIIPTRAVRGLIRTCIETLRAVTAYRNFEIVVVENIPKEEEGWKVWLRANADKVIETVEPFNWARYNNLAAAKAEGELLLFLNDDIEIIEPDWLDALVEQALRPEVAVVGPQLLYPDRSVQHAGVFLAAMGRTRHAFRHSQEGDPGYFALALTQRNVIAVTGACLLTRRETFDRLGRFNEAHSVVNNDLDFCLRAWRAGLLNVYTPYAKLIHHELASRGAMDDEYDAAGFQSEWRDIFIAGDPYFHPSLSRDADDYVPEREAVQVVCAGHPVLAKEDVRRILVVKVDHIGDCVLALPAVRRLKVEFPHARLCVLTAASTRAIWSLEPAVDEIIEFDYFHARSSMGKKELSDATLAELQGRLAPYRFDLAIDFRKHLDTRHILQYTGARRLAGFNHQGRFQWLDFALEWEGDFAYARKRQHVGDDLVNLVKAVATECETDRTVIASPPAAKLGKLGTRLFRRRVVGVHAGAGNRTKQWPPQYFGELIDLLIEEEGVNVALVGGADEREIVARVLEHVRNRKAVTDLVGKLTLDELPRFLARCALFVGNDSGPKHIAAGLGVATVGIHSGVIDAQEWGPIGLRAVAIRRDMLCSPCYLERAEDCHRGLSCLVGLGAGEVYRLCRRLLATAPAAERAVRLPSADL